MNRFPGVLLSAALLSGLISGCGGLSAPKPLSDAVTKAELRLAAGLIMPLLSATTRQLAAREFDQPLLPVSPSVGAQGLTPAALNCGAATPSGATDADHDRIPAEVSAQLQCSYTDEDAETSSALQLGGSMTIRDNDDQDAAAGLSSRAALSGTAQTRYKGVSASLNTTTSAQAELHPSGPGQYGGSLSFVSESVGSGGAFGLSSSVTLRRALSAQLGLTPDADQRGGQLSLSGTLQTRNDLSKHASDLRLSGSLHAAQGMCQAADSGSVVFSKGDVSLKATVTGCGTYSYE